ncbi:hypothetical protein GMB86_11025 [Terrilactibacillus sp. BCM23-1]|uniref:NERD domain-containing protein n=1 Tax=Terrilactibacillus tamarindi TaxID=2599694 RepID=A0A6N8CQN7_9BACI|nr:nuclease-related domain-containing protein [Terrilactibacillus tamarindi]MTT32539.1 hypothetical protein [Terrilactibacillus tamarindi]
MAQLIKVNECISRYEGDLQRYANRFITLKQRRWLQWRDQFEKPQDDRSVRLAKRFSSISNIEQLKSAYYKWLFDQQLIWATSTAHFYSENHEDLSRVTWLQFCLSKLNDVTFILYKPVLLMKQTTLQLDSLIITNDTLWCVKPLIGEDSSVFQEINNRLWREMKREESPQFINPFISLKRTKTALRTFLQTQNLSMPIKFLIFAPNSYVEFVHHDTDIEICDSRDKNQLSEKIGRHSSTLKSLQIITTNRLLSKMATTAIKRD